MNKKVIFDLSTLEKRNAQEAISQYESAFKEFLTGLSIPEFDPLPGDETCNQVLISGLTVYIDASKASEYLWNAKPVKEGNVVLRSKEGRYITLKFSLGKSENIITVYPGREVSINMLLNKIAKAVSERKAILAKIEAAEADTLPIKKTIIDHFGGIVGIGTVVAITAFNGFLDFIFSAGSLRTTASGKFINFYINETALAEEDFKNLSVNANAAMDTAKLIIMRDTLPQEAILWIGMQETQTTVYSKN